VHCFPTPSPPAKPAGIVAIHLPVSTLATLNLFFVLGLFGVYLKVALLDQQWEAVARFLGRRDLTDISMFERLGYFHADIVLNLIAVPVVATTIFCAVFRRHRVAAATVATVIASVIYYIELRAQNQVGQYISRDVIGDLIGWGIGLPGMTVQYISLISLMELAALLTAILLIAGIARLARAGEHDRHAFAADRCRRILQGGAIAFACTAGVLTPISYACRLPGSQLNASAVGRAFAALAAPDHEHEPAGLSLRQVLDITRAQTGTAQLNRSDPYVGREAGSDLLVFMMETGPALALDLADVGRSLPGTGPLYDRSLVALRHYTTHPYSSDALYSVLSGLYPPGRRRLLRAAHGEHVNALLTALEPDVPVRRVYVPGLYNIELDDEMYGVFGAETLYVADEQPGDPLSHVARRRADALIAQLEREGSRFAPRAADVLRSRLRSDFQILERVKADITAAISSHRRYSVIFCPQIGHGPWHALHGEENVRARGRGVMLLQDLWLKELVDTIRSLGRLEHTVIAVTADHGIRTRAEDPALRIGRLSEYMFRVPLIIYAPQTLKAPLTIRTPTSHVDLSPTLTALFGKTKSAANMQGVPLWQRTPADRLYFFGASYGGADGFTENGRYYMRQTISGAVYASSELSFDDEDQAVSGDPDIRRVTDALTNATGLQHALVSRLLREPRP
jgi:hypothetical protein